MPTSRRTSRATAVGLALAAALAIATSGAGVAAATQAFETEADSYTSADSPQRTHGSLDHMKVDMKRDGVPRFGYLRFEVDDVANVSRAMLRVYAITANAVGVTVHSVANDWDEAAVTWENAPTPARDAVAFSGPIASAGTWLALDVTSVVQGAGSYSFALTTTSMSDMLLASRESGPATAPQLVVEDETVGVEATASTTSGNGRGKKKPPPDRSAPSMPETLVKTGSTEAQVSLAWSASTDDVGVTGYGVYRDGALVGSTTTQTTHAVGGLTCGTSYVFEVDAVDAAGNRSPKKSLAASSSACAAPAPAPPPDTTPPSSPATLVKASSTETQVVLSWSASTDNVGVSAYGVYRDGALVGSTTQTTYAVNGLACGTSYVFGVDAVDTAGNRSARKLLTASTNACPTPAPAPTPDTTAPTMPATLTMTAATEVQVSLAWGVSTDNVGVTGYGVYRDGALVGSTTTQTTYTVSGLACGKSYVFAVDAVDAAGNRSLRKTLTASTTACAPAPAPQPPSGDLSFPVRAAFYYPWFPETWSVGGVHVKYRPTLGYYASGDPAVAESHVRQLEYGGFGAAIASWWGPGTHSESSRLPLLLNTTASRGSSLKWAVYHELEGSSNPSVTAIQSDLSYLSKYTGHSAYARVGGKPVIFVYNANDSTCEVADRWKQASLGAWYVVLKVFSGYANCANQPDSWHQYGPAVAESVHLPHSFNISPGFWLANEATPRLARDPVRWQQNVRNMIASGAKWQLVTSFNEWGEGTAVENALDWMSASGYGVYLDALHTNGGSAPSAPPPSSDTSPPTTPTGLTATGATTTSLSFSWNSSSDNVGVTGYGVYRDGTLVASNAQSSYTLAGLVCGRSYVVAIDAYDAAGNRSAKSTALTLATSACPVSDTLAPTAPSGLTATVATETSVTVAWLASTDNVGVTGYNLYRDGAYATSTMLLTHTFAGLACGSSHSFGVEAFDAAGNRSMRTTLTFATSACSAPPSGGDPVIAVAGDIAGEGSGDGATATLLDSIRPTAVLTAGDNAYPDGTASDFSTYYHPTWGRFKSVTFPTPGNHDYLTSGASGYFGYFGSRAGTAGKGWYSYDLGAWHLIALNSEVAHGATSEQVTWLKNDLAASGAKCVLAYWHKPRFSAGVYTDRSEFQPFWDALYAANAEVVVNGHDHNYQRYAPLTPAGARDDARGIREFVVGTGGRSHYALQTDARHEAADSSSFGVLKLTLRADGYAWQFVTEAGRTFTDSGSNACH